MVTKEYGRVGEKLFHATMENGLHVYVDVKPEYAKSFAFFATNYGGMDMRFQLDGTWQDTPAGVAHFLEHKMFDTEDGNALQTLAANGASPNAFTSSAITGYYFVSTEHFEENLETLLSFVSIPYFTPESVGKEQGIIGQEIRMIEDDPSWRVFMGLMETLYERHPIRVSVAGSIESIAEISDKTLYGCHKAFYNPANMVLTVAGNVDPEQVCALCRKILPKEGNGDILRDYGGVEKTTAAKREQVLEMEVSTPIFQLGWKADPAPTGEEHLRSQLLGELCCEALFGVSSPLYADLYAKGLINSSFGGGYEAYPGCALLSAGGESRDPWAVREAVQAEIARVGKDGIDPALWGRLKKAAYGNRVRGLNSFENICVELAQGHFAGVEYLRFPEVFDAIAKCDVEDCIRAWMTDERSALSVVRPKEGNG